MLTFIKKNHMTETLEITAKSRVGLAHYFENYTLEQLNKIPEPFKNNLIWNLAHVIVTEQLLVYGRSGLPMMVPDEMVAKFRGGTKPEADVTQAEVDEIKSLLFTTIEKTRADYAAGVFKNYESITTKTGFTINSVEDALNFNNFHEGAHMGVMLGIRKFV